ELHDGQQGDEDDGQAEGKLDRGLPVLAAVRPAPPAPHWRPHPMRDVITSITRSRRRPILPAPPPAVAQAMSSKATRAAPSRTNAYSAVAWPRSPRVTSHVRTRTTNHSIGHLPGRATVAGEPARPRSGSERER